MINGSLQYAKAMFWRRVSFVQRYGDSEEISGMYQHFDFRGWGEMEGIDIWNDMNQELINFWQPVIDRQKVKI